MAPPIPQPETTLTFVTDMKGRSTLVPVPVLPSHPSTSTSSSNLIQPPPQPQTNGHATSTASEGVRIGREELDNIRKEFDDGKCSKERLNELFQTLLNHSQSLLSTPPPPQVIPPPLTSLERTLYETSYSQLERQAQLLASRLSKLRRKTMFENNVTPPSGLGVGGSGDRGKGGMMGGVYVVGPWEEGIGRGGKDEESEERRLRVDLRDTQRKLLDAQSQITHLTDSLKSLRSQLLLSTPLIATDITIVSPPPPSPPLSPSQPSPRKKRPVTLGDAESEHLILAGKKLSHVRRINRVGLNSAILHQAKEIVELQEEEEKDGRDGESSRDKIRKVTPLEELEERAKEARRVIAEAEEKEKSKLTKRRRFIGDGGGNSDDEDDEDESEMTSKTLNVLSTPKPASPRTPKKVRTPARELGGVGGMRSQPQTPRTPNTKRRMIGGVSSTAGPGMGGLGGGGGVNLFSSPGGGGFVELLQAAETVLSPGKKEKERDREKAKGKGRDRESDLGDGFDEEDNEMTVKKKRRVEGGGGGGGLGKGRRREEEDSSDIEMTPTLLATSSPIPPHTPQSHHQSPSTPQLTPTHQLSRSEPAATGGFPFSALDVLADQAFSASQEDGVGLGVGLLSPPPVSQVQRTVERSGRGKKVVEPTTSDIEEGEGGGVGAGAGAGDGWDDSGEDEVGGGGEEGESKRPRSPYVKWTVEEDELLIRAVIAHGNRWDQVALDVPSRSYHQCRQRWLRGLKSGETIPAELSRYTDDARAAVDQYERAKKSFRPVEVDGRL